MPWVCISLQNQESRRSLIPFNKLGGATYANLLTNVTHICVVCCTRVMAKTIERFIRELDVQFSKYLIKDAMGECLFLILDVSRCNDYLFLTFGGLEKILLHFTSMRTI
jgi:hypothetical protein